MERGEYGKAAGKYQEAVALDPDDLALRFALGTAYSHLGRRAEAAEQFQRVVKRAEVSGPLEWPDGSSRERLIKVRVTLTGEDDAMRSVNLSRPFRQGEAYEFHDLAPGKYRLVAKAEDGAPTLELWDQYVTVEAGKVTQLPLLATKSKVKPDQFPGPPPK